MAAMATTTPASSNQKSPNFADHPFLIALDFDFNITTWGELVCLATKSHSEAQSLHLQICYLINARINLELLSGDSTYEYATHLLRQEFKMLEDKLKGLVRLLEEVGNTACKQAKLMNSAVHVNGECDVDSLFALGRKIRFTRRRGYDWYWGLRGLVLRRHAHQIE
ncbi:MAG: hypothetical protein Q9184_007870 [Pyrenodesmia sp. 2 TL-2023]